MEGLIEKSERLKREALSLFQRTGLHDTLKQYGNVFLQGSFDLNLMTKRDLDIYVINESITREESIRALNEFLNQDSFYGYYFFDRVTLPKAGLPNGYYIGLKAQNKDTNWKIDIWFLTQEDQNSSELMDFVHKHLDDNSRLKILELKTIRDERNLDIPGYQIYKAVLKGHISTFDELEKYLSTYYK